MNHNKIGNEWDVELVVWNSVHCAVRWHQKHFKFNSINKLYGTIFTNRLQCVNKGNNYISLKNSALGHAVNANFSAPPENSHRSTHNEAKIELAGTNSEFSWGGRYFQTEPPKYKYRNLWLGPLMNQITWSSKALGING